MNDFLWAYLACFLIAFGVALILTVAAIGDYHSTLEFRHLHNDQDRLNAAKSVLTAKKVLLFTPVFPVIVLWLMSLAVKWFRRECDAAAGYVEEIESLEMKKLIERHKRELKEAREQARLEEHAEWEKAFVSMLKD